MKLEIMNRSIYSREMYLRTLLLQLNAKYYFVHSFYAVPFNNNEQHFIFKKSYAICQS